MASDPSLFGFFVFNFSGLSFLSLLVEVEYSTILPMESLHDDLNRMHPGSHDTEVSGFHHCNAEPTPNIPACPVVGLLPIYGELGRQVLQSGLRVCAQRAVYRDN